MKFKSRIVKTKAGPLLLRKVRMADAKELNRIFCTPAVNRFLMFPPSSVKKTKEGIRKDSKGRMLGIVAILNGRMAGRAQLWPQVGRASHTANFGIMVDERFHSKGVGTALLKALFGTAKRNGIEKIDGSYIKGNKNGAELYKKLGFKIEGLRQKSFKRDGKYVDHVMIGKWL